jgi:3-methyladenine DNA glycosylase Tag
MTDFASIFAAAEARAGGAPALEARLPAPKSAAELRAVGDDHYLSLMSLRIFRAGLKHSLVDAKWPAFEAAFEGFEPRRVRAMSDEAVEALLNDRRLIRHGGKLMAVRNNAAAMCDLSDEAGGFGAYLADWPGSNIVGLWADLTRRFKQLGGNSGPYFLRMAGKDSFVLTDSVVRGLAHWGAFAGNPKTKAGAKAVQAVFNAWAEESGRPLSQLSMILALSSD